MDSRPTRSPSVGRARGDSRLLWRRVFVALSTWLIGLTTGAMFFSVVFGHRLRPFLVRGSSATLVHRPVRSCALGEWVRLSAVVRGHVPRVRVLYRAVDPSGRSIQSGSASMVYSPVGRLWAVALPPLQKGWSYRYRLEAGAGGRVRIPSAGELRARFEEEVRAELLAGHVVLTLVAGVLLLTAFHRALGELTGLHARGTHRVWIWHAMSMFVLGAVVVGSIISSRALGTSWGGWPFGADVTDTKSEAIVLYWLMLLVLTVRRPRVSAVGTVAGALATMGLYLLPHGGVS